MIMGPGIKKIQTLKTSVCCVRADMKEAKQ